ncbi:MAG: Flp pilus assembly complex ATPase component TadA [Planctomycetes bacterium]|nr:Flp pilus assembly complex ATPase component TadA [Planctomycetota bacterium]
MKPQKQTQKAGKNVNKTAKEAASPGGSDAAGKSGGELLDMDEAIGMLKTTRPTFYRWLKSGKLKGLKAGRQWRFRREDVDRFMRGQLPQVEMAGDFGPLIADLQGRIAGLRGKTAVDDAGDDADQPAAAVNLMIKLGFYLNSSDIHIGPLYLNNRELGVLRYRIDGVLQKGIEFDIKLLPAIVARWKTMAGCSLDDKRRPQDGRIVLDIGGRSLDIRVCFLPAMFGESITARLLSRESVQLDLNKMGYSKDVLDGVIKAIEMPQGMTVVTGPAGIGKTTTLYACLSYLAKQELKTISIEDPVEFALPWITQVQVMPAQGLTFASSLRSSLRSDPDIVMVSEIRDTETLQLSLQMALTGHSVLTSVHAEDAAAAIVRMLDIGAVPFVLADSINLILSQRLVRRTCPDCKRVPSDPRKVEMVRQMAARLGCTDTGKTGEFQRGAGCPKCHGTGYSGRILISEALVMTPELIAAVLQRAPVAELRKAAVAGGMTPMVADGLRLAAAGQTTLDEIFRVMPGQLMRDA